MAAQPQTLDALVHAVRALSQTVVDLRETIQAQQTGGSILGPWSLLTAIGGLVAFHIGLFTLVGRERKSPYVINWVFKIFLICLLAAIFGVIATLVTSPIWRTYLLFVGTAVLAFGFTLSFFYVYRILIRFVHFEDSVQFKKLPLIRAVRRGMRSREPRSYAHNPTAISAAAKQDISQIVSASATQRRKEDIERATSLALKLTSYDDCNQLLADLSVVFLKNEYTVQFLTAARHPIEFIRYLKDYAEAKGLTPWEKYAKHIVVIDAYTPHFAFLDSIYARRDRELASLNVTSITSKMTYAGLHTSSANAFNEIEKKEGEKIRQPTLVIYEGTYGIADLESPEQYRVFVRHVLPSEVMWGGMFTVFAEAAIADQDWNLLRAYAKVAMELGRSANSVSGEKTGG